MQPRRDRNQVPDHGEQPANQGADFAVLREESLGAQQILLSEQHVSAIPLDQRPADQLCAVIIRQRADDAPHDTAEQGQREAHLALGGPIPHRRHDQLTRHRQNRRLHCHERNDAGISEIEQRVKQPLDEPLKHRSRARRPAGQSGPRQSATCGFLRRSGAPTSTSERLWRLRG